MDIWGISVFWLWGMMLLRIFMYKFLCRHMFPFLLGRYLRVELLDHMVIDHRCMILLLDTQFYFIYLYMSFLMTVPHCLDYCSFVLSLNLRGVSPPTLFFFFKIILARQGTCNSICILELTLNGYECMKWIFSLSISAISANQSIWNTTLTNWRVKIIWSSQ